jgi:hypothetical protein
MLEDLAILTGRRERRPGGQYDRQPGESLHGAGPRVHAETIDYVDMSRAGIIDPTKVERDIAPFHVGRGGKSSDFSG